MAEVISGHRAASAGLSNCHVGPSTPRVYNPGQSDLVERHQERWCDGDVDRQSVAEDVHRVNEGIDQNPSLGGLAAIPLLTKGTVRRIDIISCF